MGRHFEIRLYQPGNRTLRQDWHALSRATANFVACLEIVGGLMLLSGLLTRFISVLFIIEMIVAVLSTKITLCTSPLPLPPTLPKAGAWAVLHEIRSDYAQIMTAIFLLANGPGKWSLDALLHNKRETVPARVRAEAPVLAA